MKITELPAYQRLVKAFREKGYTQGVADDMPIYDWNGGIVVNPTPGHYAYGITHGEIQLRDVPQRYRTRSFFLHTLTGCHEDIVAYVREHPTEFDRQFFKDHIATDYYGLEFEMNDFEFMPLEFVDEEMVVCAMLRSIHMRYSERRGDCKAWFYSVYKRKPELLTRDLYILGARCFAEKRSGKNKFLEITPKEYRTPEYYYALCLKNRTPVMEDIPEEVLTTDFLVDLLQDAPENIQCFSENAMEKEVPIKRKHMVKAWQAAIILDGYEIRNLLLNDEKIAFFMSLYDKDSSEYELGFKDHYKKYLRQKNATAEPKNDATERAGMTTLLGALLGMSPDSAVDIGTATMNVATDHQTMLPIHLYRGLLVPEEYCKKLDKEEYLLEIYKKLGIQVIEEADYFYYRAILPENIFVVQDENGYCIKDSEEKSLIHYYDRGTFYDRTVVVDEVNVTLSE